MAPDSCQFLVQVPPCCGLVRRHRSLLGASAGQLALAVAPAQFRQVLVQAPPRRRLRNRLRHQMHFVRVTVEISFCNDREARGSKIHSSVNPRSMHNPAPQVAWLACPSWHRNKDTSDTESGQRQCHVGAPSRVASKCLRCRHHLKILSWAV